MSSIIPAQYEPWPALSYEDFKPTQYLLHRIAQALGKLKLATPFDPHWSNVALWLTSQGLTTGPIPYGMGTYSIDLDLIHHQVHCTSSWGDSASFSVRSMSVAQFIGIFLGALSDMGIVISINLMPQEVPNPIAFDKDIETREYNPGLANAWLRIMISSYRVMQRYHSHYYGISPPIGLMWGTLDLRDARYQGIHITGTGANAGYLRRNAMDDAQVEVGWWSGSEQYPRPAYFSFLYPEVKGLEKARIKPRKARWDNTLREFILDYDDVRTAKNPEEELLTFFESTYQSETDIAGWDKSLLVPGQPV
ncbi:hypothetical protein AQUSIP_13780 [Aquicella siphonis]|uniref:Uncharacterized protein n=1 Tax=Aquicella siphonis TaxID=254247 RepID=A0A5E4PGR6_9COXI|nr:DUF5996 family protein [Aquicella siphonis]VVC76074.1 hypothetical protein AQUSIP_13780 [Aquicella siphonis]